MTNPLINSRNPFRALGYETDDIIPEGGMGAIVAPAGVGKTALLVQLALNAMLRQEKVLHISLNDPVKKVTLWYREMFANIGGHLGVSDIQGTWEAILSNRFIMTFTIDGFNVPKLKERLTDLKVQDIFSPQFIIIDGLKFDVSSPDTVHDLKSMAEKYRMRLWFTVHAGSRDAAGSSELPPIFLQMIKTFDVVFKLQEKGDAVLIQPIDGITNTAEQLYLDPGTLLIKDRSRG
jgi:hypothetical protein